MPRIFGRIHIYLGFWLASAPLAQAVTILRLTTAPPKVRLCENLLKALDDIPETSDPHFVPVFFQTLNIYLMPRFEGLSDYKGLESLDYMQRLLLNPKRPLSAAKLHNLFRRTSRLGTDHHLAAFLVALFELNRQGATGTGEGDFGGPPQKWKKPGEQAADQLEASFRDLNRAWGALGKTERQVVTRWLGQILTEGFRVASVRVWRLPSLVDRRLALGPPRQRAPGEARRHHLEVGRRLLRLYGLDSAHVSESLEADLRDLLFFLQG